MQLQLNRRRLLATVGNLLGWSVAGGACFAFLDVPSADTWLAQLSSRVNVCRHARRLGQGYLVLHPAERDQQLLSRLLRTALIPVGAVPPIGQAALERMLTARARQEFAEQDTVVVHGWVLARTEARLCALCAS